jgi:hypothetical protein
MGGGGKTIPMPKVHAGKGFQAISLAPALQGKPEFLVNLSIHGTVV